MARDAAPELGSDLAEGQVDLVVEGDDPLVADAELAAGGAGGVAGLVHEGLGQEDRDARAARPDPALGDQPAEALAGPRQLPAGAERVRDLEAGVVAGARVARARVAEADDRIGSPVEASAGLARAATAEERHGRALALVVAAAAVGRLLAALALSRLLALGGLLALLADELGLLLDLGLLLESWAG